MGQKGSEGAKYGGTGRLGKRDGGGYNLSMSVENR
jgi:hypothetical protein